MERLYFQLYFILSIFSCLSCKRISPEAPERSKLDSTMSVQESVLNIPISYDIKRLESWVNQKIQGTFVNQGLYINEKGDSLFLTVNKLAPIKMSWHNATLYYELPLALSGTIYKRIGRAVISNPDPIQTELLIKLASEVDLDEEWNLKTKSRIEQIEWVKEPSVRLGPFNLSLTRQLNKMLLEKQDTLIQMMDAAVYEHLDIQKVIARLWRDIQKPIYIHKNDPVVYLKSRASLVEGKLIRNNSRNVKLDLSLRTKATLAMEDEFLPPLNPRLPKFRVKQSDNESFNIAIHGLLTFDKINLELNKFLKNKEIEVRGYKSKIKEVEVYGSAQSLVVRVDVKGDLKGRLYLLGELNYNAEQQIFSVVNFRYDLDTESKLVRTAEHFLKDRIMGEIQQYLSYDVSEHLEELPGLISRAIDEGKSGRAISLSIDELNIKDWSSLITAKNIQFVVEAEGRAELEIQELKRGRKVQIGQVARL